MSVGGSDEQHAEHKMVGMSIGRGSGSDCGGLEGGTREEVLGV